jgi:molybdopterin-guanine dinucleotide biosynthesis protein B
MLPEVQVPVLGFAAFSGSGKTTLLRALVTILTQRGYRVGVVKHAHHSFDIDKPGKDSYELRKAGAVQTLVGSRNRWALVTETDGATEPQLCELLAHMDPTTLDFVLVEGFKSEPIPKIEVYRPALGYPLLHPRDDSIVAIATDGDLPAGTTLPLLDLNRPEDVAEFVVRFLLGAQSPPHTNSIQRQTR